MILAPAIRALCGSRGPRGKPASACRNDPCGAANRRCGSSWSIALESWPRSITVATVAFVGGSLVPRGGHNILEPALYGVPIVHRQHYENFRDIVNFLCQPQAVVSSGLRTPARVDGADRETKKNALRSAGMHWPRWNRSAGNGQNRSGSAQVDERAVRRLRMKSTTAFTEPPLPWQYVVRSGRTLFAPLTAARSQRRQPVRRWFRQTRSSSRSATPASTCIRFDVLSRGIPPQNSRSPR